LVLSPEGRGKIPSPLRGEVQDEGETEKQDGIKLPPHLSPLPKGERRKCALSTS